MNQPPTTGERPRVERPRVEPEIIPPGRNGPPRHGDERMAGARIYVTRIGPIGAILVALIIGLLSVMTLVVLAGALLVWIPVLGLIVAAAIIANTLRGHFRRRR